MNVACLCNFVFFGFISPFPSPFRGKFVLMSHIFHACCFSLQFHLPLFYLFIFFVFSDQNFLFMSHLSSACLIYLNFIFLGFISSSPSYFPTKLYINTSFFLCVLLFYPVTSLVSWAADVADVYFVQFSLAFSYLPYNRFNHYTQQHILVLEFNIMLPFTTRSPKWTFSMTLPTKHLNVVPVIYMRAAWAPVVTRTLVIWATGNKFWIHEC